jgi:hypothetical protein
MKKAKKTSVAQFPQTKSAEKAMFKELNEVLHRHGVGGKIGALRVRAKGATESGLALEAGCTCVPPKTIFWYWEMEGGVLVRKCDCQ